MCDTDIRPKSKARKPRAPRYYVDQDPKPRAPRMAPALPLPGPGPVVVARPVPQGASLTINRRGTLSLKTAPGVPQCAKPGHTDCRYVVRLTCAPSLTSEGYLVAHESIDVRAREAAAQPGTCELIALRVGAAVLALAHSASLDVKRCEVIVTPILPDGAAPQAFMTFTWEPTL